MKSRISLFRKLRVLVGMCFKACPLYITIFILVSVSHGLIMVCNTMFTQFFFDIISTNVKKNSTYVIYAIVALGVVLVIQQMLNGILNFMGWHMELKVNRNMIFNFHEKIALYSPIDFENTVELDKINRAANGARNTMEVGGTILMLITFYVPYFLFMSFYLFKLKPVLIIVMLVVFLPNYFTQYVRTRVFSDLEDESAPIRRKVDYYADCITGKEIRQWGTYYYFRNLLKSSIATLEGKIWKTEFKIGKWELILNSCTVAGYICILLLLVYYLLRHEISVGAFAAIFASIDTMYLLMNEIVCFHFGNLTKNIGTVNNYIEFIQNKKIVPDEEIEFDLSKGILLKNVSFKYPNAKRFVLKNINLQIKPGETVAIVGENGAGKSTLLKLLTGLYKPTVGVIQIGGHDTQLNSKNLLDHISGIFQNYQRYKMSLRDNVSISNFDNVDDNKIMKIGKKMDIFKSFKNEEVLDTMLSREFDGIELSIGQWQRIAIARGLYKCHDIIILDEPTAAIDPLEETYVYKRFSEISMEKTALIITHRLGAVKIADRILVLSDGEIKEQGTHQQLIALDGLYAKMFKAQSKWYS